jgi:hypothetical protein
MSIRLAPLAGTVRQHQGHQDLSWLTGIRPWLVLAVAAAAVLLGGLFGVGIGHHLVSGGYFDPHAESSNVPRPEEGPRSTPAGSFQDTVAVPVA